MPIYQLVHSGIPLSLSDRNRLAQGILAIHASETHAPEPFVRVVFGMLPLGTIYTAGKIAPSLVLNCGIRSGRTNETRQSIIRRCYDLLREVTQAPPDQIVVVATEAESASVMEAGFFMPEPNQDDEAAWIAELQQAYPGEYDDWGAHGKIDNGEEDLDAFGERAADLRRLAEQMLVQAQRQGTNTVQLLEPLNQFIGERLAQAKQTVTAAGSAGSSGGAESGGQK